ncbi:MAG: molybdenum cofactor cytidylyltransferase [Paracoccaceae bacterium]|jgi:molybdenum cofactor cytidylyltransferase
MWFGALPPAQALGAILAHSMQVAGKPWRKGLVLDAQAVAALQQAGIREVTVAQLGTGDIEENTAARRLAAALVPDPVAACLTRGTAFTGRVNINAVGPGIVEVDARAVRALNRVDPSVTLATLAPHTRVGTRTLVGTVKIISYGVTEASLQQACAVAHAALRVRPVERRSAGLVLTEVPGQKKSLTVKGQAAIAQRLAALGMALAEVRVVAHETTALAQGLCGLTGEITLILTGSATSDLHDVGPQGVRVAGGQVARFGMPVDPGNLLFIGDLEGKPVIGLPGCARSPALNGADWVLERLACGLEVTDDDIAAMGVGGLLKEIPMRPQPREP